MLKSKQALIGWMVVLLVSSSVGFAQPLGEEMKFNNDTPTYDVAGLTAITADGPVILARTGGEDREPKISILNNGSTNVFWVNRNGSHHVSGVDANGVRLFPIFEKDTDIDIIVGINTGSNTNWTLDKSDPLSGRFLAGATYQSEGLAGSTAVIPDTVVDKNGIRGDNSQGHGFFKLFDDQLQPISASPISISEFTAGHREWDCCWLSDGKFVIGTITQDHQYDADPDYPAGGNKTGAINIFNADGTRFMAEFFVDDLTGQQQDLRLGALANGFVCTYIDNDSSVGGTSLYKGIIFDNSGNRVKEFLMTDTEFGFNPVWMDAGGGNQFVTIHQVTIPESFIEYGFPDYTIGTSAMLAQLWSDQGERIGPYILASQHDDFRSLGRPRCAMAPNDSFVLSWDDDSADLMQFTKCPVARVFNADGTPAADAFVVHPLPEFADSEGGDCGEPHPAISNEKVAFAWGSRGVPNGIARDIVVTVFENPAEGGTPVEAWDLY